MIEVKGFPPSSFFMARCCQFNALIAMPSLSATRLACWDRTSRVLARTPARWPALSLCAHSRQTCCSGSVTRLHFSQVSSINMGAAVEAGTEACPLFRLCGTGVQRLARQGVPDVEGARSWNRLSSKHALTGAFHEPCVLHHLVGLEHNLGPDARCGWPHLPERKLGKLCESISTRPIARLQCTVQDGECGISDSAMIESGRHVFYRDQRPALEGGMTTQLSLRPPRHEYQCLAMSESSKSRVFDWPCEARMKIGNIGCLKRLALGSSGSPRNRNLALLS